jgi:hypothetical protein
VHSKLRSALPRSYTRYQIPQILGHQILILVRGTLTNDASLILTEQENEDLAAAIDRLSPAIEQITTVVMGRSVLLLGVNPRDPIVRKLARRLIRPRTNQGPAFFVCPKFSSADKAYWARQCGRIRGTSALEYPRMVLINQVLCRPL